MIGNDHDFHSIVELAIGHAGRARGEIRFLAGLVSNGVRSLHGHIRLSSVRLETGGDEIALFQYREQLAGCQAQRGLVRTRG